MPRSSQKHSDQSDVHQLSEIESETMDILWTTDHPLTANEVVAQIFHGRHATQRELPNYTTIASMLTRLTVRELLKATKLSPRNIVYSPTLTRAQYAARAVQQIFRRIMKRSLADVLPNISHSLSSASASTADDPDIKQLADEVARLGSGKTA